MKVTKTLPKGILARLRSEVFPLLRELCDKIPGEMNQVLYRTVGPLEKWIQANERCGCLVGTIALVCKYDGHINETPTENIRRDLAYYSDQTADAVAKAIADQTRTHEIHLMGLAVSSISFELTEVWGGNNDDESDRKRTNAAIVRVCKAVIRSQLAKRDNVERLKAWRRALRRQRTAQRSL